MKTSTPKSGSSSTPPDPFAFLDVDLGWSKTSEPAGAAVTLTMNAPVVNVEPLPSTPQLAPGSTKSGSDLSPTPSPPLPSTSSMDAQILRQAKALAELDKQLGQFAAKTRTIGALLDQTTERMSTDLKAHERALGAQLVLTQGQTKTALQRQLRALSWLVLVPLTVTAALCALTAAATLAWVRIRIPNADVQTAQAQIQPRPSPPPSASGRRRP